MSQAQLLAAPFEASQLKQVQGATYIPIAEVIDRLNTVLGPSGWSYNSQIVHDPAHPDWVIAHVELSCEIDGRVSSKGGAGGKHIELRNSDGKPVDVGNEYKAAQSDALKKAAQAFGVGLDIARPDTKDRVMPVHLGPVYMAIEELSEGHKDTLRRWMKARGMPALKRCDSEQAELILETITRLVDETGPLAEPEADTAPEAPAPPSSEAEGSPDEAEASGKSSTSRRT